VDFQIVINETPLDLTDAIIRMQLRKQPGGVIALAPLITIFDPTNGEFRINKQIINIEACNYRYDIEVETEDGQVNTWISGLFTITDDITR
jgi:hypothetical protein